MDADVAIIGGGPAGLSAAVALARSLRRVVVVDAGEPRNAPAAGAHNVLAREGASAAVLLAEGRKEAQHYGAEIVLDRVTNARRTEEGFELELAEGRSLGARRVLLATGLIDELPDVAGVRELWGKRVLHCPFCHGWEVRGQRIGVLGTGERNVHQALLFRQLSDDVTFFLHTLEHLSVEDREQFAALDIQVVAGVVRELRDGDTLHVLLSDREVSIDALVVAPRFLARADLYEQLGGTLQDHPFGAFIATDQTGRTDVSGVWAAGNVTDLMAMVSASMGAGVMAGAAINGDLVAEDAARALRASRTRVVRPSNRSDG